MQHHLIKHRLLLDNKTRQDLITNKDRTSNHEQYIYHP